MAEMKQLNLNLGGWTDTKPGYLTVDIREGAHVDLVADARDLSQHFENGTVDNIIAFEILEHYTICEGEKMLKHWSELLKVGGRLHLRVPAISLAVEQYQKGRLSWRELNRYLYGAQEWELDYHKAYWDVTPLEGILEKDNMVLEQIQYVPGTRLLYIDAVKNEPAAS